MEKQKSEDEEIEKLIYKKSKEIEAIITAKQKELDAIVSKHFQRTINYIG